MGSVLSAIRSASKTLGAVVKLLLDLNSQYQALLVRVNSAPGLPHEKPTSPYWLDDPPFPELADARSENLPREADVVVIGSGITAAAVAKGLFAASASADGPGPGPRVVVLEARSLCAGATGRNGGHLKGSPHELFPRLARHFGNEGAARLARFMLRTAEAVLEVGRAGRAADVAECRPVETVDFFLDDAAFDEVRAQCDELRRWVPEFQTRALGPDETAARFGCDRGHVRGSLVYAAGALWPYRLVTAVWRDLLDAHPGRLTVETGTPVEAIALDDAVVLGGGSRPYVVRTARGVIRARHVVHATNAHAGQFLPGLRGKLTGLKGHMTAQRPTAAATAAAATAAPMQDGGGGGGGESGGFGWKDGSAPGSRSWSVLYGGGKFDYVTQRPNGDVMLGGGFERSAGEGVDMIGTWDDSGTDGLTIAHVSGVMKAVFGDRWSGDVVRSWSGILGFTGDLAPFVGRVPDGLSGAKAAAAASSPQAMMKGVKWAAKMQAVAVADNDDGDDDGGVGDEDVKEKGEAGWKGAAAGEWVSAGYNGDGMVWAWLCGTALGVMVAGREDAVLDRADGFPGGRLAEWFPPELLVTEARVRKADLTNLVDEVL
ncbi:FAD dependent oxidoreductase [Colletotrichum falcatum]|nr:FAD dependent oxidoreductase [Colletotrichum falcatum]